MKYYIVNSFGHGYHWQDSINGVFTSFEEAKKALIKRFKADNNKILSIDEGKEITMFHTSDGTWRIREFSINELI